MIWIRDGAVVHQAEVLAGGERMSAVRRDRRFGRHARVPDKMCSREFGEVVTPRDVGGVSDVLVDIHRASGGEHMQLRESLLDPGLDVVRRFVAGQDGVVALYPKLRIGSEVA